MADRPPRDVSPEELVEAMRQVEVSDVLLSTLATVAQLGFSKLADRDLDGARLAIEALRALVPVLETSVPQETLRDFNGVVANLQLGYAAAAQDAREEPSAGPPPEPSETVAEPPKTGSATDGPETPEGEGGEVPGEGR